MCTGQYNGHPTSGSLIPVQQETVLPTFFNRYIYGDGIRLKSSYDGRDVLPPNRVTDLRTNFVDINSYSLELRWTAPRDDYGTSQLISNNLIQIVHAN